MTQISTLSRRRRDPNAEPPFQGWRTPQAIFDQLNIEECMGYGLDLFADRDNAKCDRYFTEMNSAFDNDWSLTAAHAFGNPPYSGRNQERALAKAIHEVRVVRALDHVDLLMQASTATKWFYRALTECEVHLFRGRISFDVPPNMVNPDRPSFSNVLVRISADDPKRGLTAIRDCRTGRIVHSFGGQ